MRFKMRIKMHGKLIINLVAALTIAAMAGSAMAQNEEPPPKENGASAPAPAAGDAAKYGRLTTLLNQATQINQEEVQMAGIAKDRAGSNQALITYADTLKADHQANQEAVKALANQKNIRLNDNQSNAATNAQNQLSNLKGASFNTAFLQHEIQGHREALDQFHNAQQEFRGDRDVETYIGQTVPVLQAHLRMAESLRREASAGSTENPANNKTTGASSD